MVGVPGHVVKHNNVRIPYEDLNQTDLPDPVQNEMDQIRESLDALQKAEESRKGTGQEIWSEE